MTGRGSRVTRFGRLLCRLGRHSLWYRIGPAADHVVRGCWRCGKINVLPIESPFAAPYVLPSDAESVRHLFDERGWPK
jgi:hypothetical protein